MTGNQIHNDMPLVLHKTVSLHLLKEQMGVIPEGRETKSSPVPEFEIFEKHCITQT